MRVTIQLPDDISAALEEQWDDVPRRSLEAIAVEAYRTGALTDSQVRRLLGFESRFQVHALLKDLPHARLGRTAAHAELVVTDGGRPVLREPLAALRAAWLAPLDLDHEHAAGAAR